MQLDDIESRHWLHIGIEPNSWFTGVIDIKFVDTMSKR